MQKFKKCSLCAWHKVFTMYRYPHGSAHDLGNLGGNCAALCESPVFGPFGNTALYINDKGQVVGTSALSDEGPFHAFLWTRETGKMQDLGTLKGDVASVALSINDKGEMVGASIDATGNTRAFLRKNGKMIDLQTLIPDDSPLLPLNAEIINSSGQITGFGLLKSTGDIHGFVATPCDRDHGGRDWCRDDVGGDADADNTEGPKAPLLENARRQLRQQPGRGHHFDRSRY